MDFFTYQGKDWTDNPFIKYEITCIKIVAAKFSIMHKSNQYIFGTIFFVFVWLPLFVFTAWIDSLEKQRPPTFIVTVYQRRL